MDELPPKLPTELDGLDRVIGLLGSIIQGHELRQGHRRELHELIGVMPKAERAKRWKAELKKLRAELVDELLKEQGAGP